VTQINSPAVPYERNNGSASLANVSADRAVLSVEVPVGISVGAGPDGADKLSFPTWTPEQEAQVATALRVAAALMPTGARIHLGITHGPIVLHSELTGDQGDRDD
jgi:hypothetical protein